MKRMVTLVLVAALAACGDGGGSGADDVGGDPAAVGGGAGLEGTFLRWPGTGTITQNSYGLDHDENGDPLWPEWGHVYASRPEHRHWALDVDLYEQTNPDAIPDPSNVQGLGYVYAAGPGVVSILGGGNNTVEIDHGGGLVTRYLHMQELFVASGQSVASGQLIGMEGSAGTSTNPHLHFEVRAAGVLQHFDANLTHITKGEPVMPVFAYSTASPPAPQILTPSNGAMVASSSLYVDWTDVPGADQYQIEVDATPTWTTVSSASVSLGEAGTHWITVSAHTSTGWGMATQISVSYSPSGSSSPPPPAVIYSPGNGASLVSSPVTFDWADVADADAYAVAVFDSGGFPVYQSGPAGSADSVPLEYQGAYTFTVSAHNSAGWGQAAEVSVTYSPASSTVPPAPVISFPGSGATLASPSVGFDWSDVSGADMYCALVTHSSGAVAHQSWPTASSQTVSLPAYGSYTFQISAHNSAGWGPVAQVVATYPEPPPLPDLSVSAAVGASYASGQSSVQIPVTVQRSGGALTSGTYVTARLYWSNDPVWNSGDQLLWESNGSTPDYPSSFLNSYGSKSVVATVTIPAGLASGTYYVVAVVDPTGYHAESNEGNNAAAYSTTIAFKAMQVTSGPLNVRSGPGTSYSIIGQATAGQVYISDQSTGGWYRIWWGNGQGWCSGDYLAQVSGTAVKVTGSLNVRSGAGTSYSILGTTAAGEHWYVVETSGEWYRIWWKGQSAWIWNGYTQALSF